MVKHEMIMPYVVSLPSNCIFLQHDRPVRQPQFFNNDASDLLAGINCGWTSSGIFILLLVDVGCSVVQQNLIIE